MANYYYGGNLLPEIPADVLASHPYVWMMKSTNNTYNVIFATLPWHYSSGKMNLSATGENIRYTMVTVTSGWKYDVKYTDSGGYSVTGEIVWASHDIPNGSATATEIYFYGSDPVPEETEEPETVTQYLIRSDTLTAIADGFRSSRETTKKYTLDEMAVLAAEKTSGGGSMFASNASGRIPEYEKGTANSEFTLNFESSAIGALQEG